MKYILQINTGNTQTQNYTASNIVEKLNHLTKYIDVSRVIFGWYNNPKENKIIVDYLHSKKIEAYFWLPVFAEIIDLDKEDKYQESNYFIKKTSKLSEGDNFELVCQSSNKNIEYIINQFEEISKDINLDGVFLDRIRYKSPALSKDAIFGCVCDNCKEMLENISIDKDVYNKLIPIKIINGIYLYNNDNVNNLMKIKRDVINKQIKKLYSYFNSHNLKVGLDTFALCIADFVGQDIVSLSKYANFIKPMFYLKTTAPAGLPYELSGLPNNITEQLNRLWNIDLKTIDGSIKQCKYLLDRNINITPGIDVNRIEGICNSSVEYVKEYIDKLKGINCKEVVLSWDSMKIDDVLINNININKLG